MAARAAPRTLTALANLQFDTRSDIAAFCQGVDNLCESLAMIVVAAADELYVRLATSGNGGYAARAKARAATRPFLHIAQLLRITGRTAHRCYRVYRRKYADEIQPAAKGRAKFNHNA